MPKHSIPAVTAAAALVCLAAGSPATGSAASATAQLTGQPTAQPTAQPRPDGTSRFVPGPCPKPPQPIEALSDARCGFLEVPENRSRPGGRTIRLAVAVIPAVSPADPARAPVVSMAGGPGADAFQDVPVLVDSGLNKDRELIVMAQRGNRYDRPNLACPEIDRFQAQAVGLGYAAQEAQQRFLKAVKDCRDRLTADGTDLGAYNTTENAADFADLRTALDINQWNVYGYSYGSDLALTYLRLHPEGIRAFAIDSVVPPQMTLPRTWGSTAEGFDTIVAACAAQPACEDRYPDLPGTLTEQVRRLEAQPLTVNVPPPSGGKPVKVVLDGGALLDTILASTPRPEDLPAALAELGDGDPERFAKARAAGSVPKAGEVAHGLTHSVVCGEWAPGYAQADVLAAGREAHPGWPDTVLAQAPHRPFQYAACDVWNVPDRTAVQRVATVSDVPALVVSGTFDVRTAVSWADDVARDLSRSTAVRLPGVGHWVVPQSYCAQSVLASFFARPTAPDSRCVDDLRPDPFTVIPK
ncbi:alpha/beta fold hydrolase [Streptomyces sp. NPDC054787]